MFAGIALRADLSQTVVKGRRPAPNNNGPGKPGPLSVSAGRGLDRRWIRLGAEVPYFKGSEAEARHVAIADGDAAAFSQQAVDRSHQAGEQGGGRQQADRCSLGHGMSPFLGAEPFRFLICN